MTAQLRNEMPLSSTSVTSADGVVTFSFTREMQSKFSPIQPLPADIMPPARPKMYFATGALDKTGAMEYHGQYRGVFIHEFFHPDAVWPASRFC